MTFGTAVVELEPEAFEAQMKWFYDNHVYAVTGQNLIDWINGKIELPARSVVLTFDMGYNSAKAIHRIIPEFEKYGMFGIFTIFTKFMNEGESVNCVNDACWEAFRYAYLSGYVDIGSHTMTHRDFATLSEKEGMNELANSKETIEEHVGNGCIVSILTWPYESVPKWGKDISQIGFTIAFAGYQYPILQNAMWKDKPEDFYQEPRVLPPNSNGISGRPNGKDLEGIMQMYTTANSNQGGW
jgi:peptidoglycan/xylan/chitin deacetylase (PgdA/CDA1 family)